MQTEEQLLAEIRRLEAQLAKQPPYWTPERIRAMRDIYLSEHPPPDSATVASPTHGKPGQQMEAALWVTSAVLSGGKDDSLTAGRSPREAWRRALDQALDAWAARVAADPEAGPESVPAADRGCRHVHAGEPVKLSGHPSCVLTVLRAHGLNTEWAM